MPEHSVCRAIWRLWGSGEAPAAPACPVCGLPNPPPDHIAGANKMVPSGLAPPVRIQLRRTKGWRLPPNTVKVDRSTEWGNPIRICEPPHTGLLAAYDWRFREPPEIPGTAAEAVAMFERFIAPDGASIGAGTKALRGKNLACWCPLDQPCHADVWLRIVNATVRDV